MIKITVYMENDHNSKYEIIEITKEELLQLACNKAKGMYIENYWNKIKAENEIEIKSKI